MQDIDFDELDRAVNTVIGSDSTDNSAPTPVADTPQVTLPVTPEPTPIAPPIAPTQPLAARRSGTGRFMDMVHPSSDMRSRTIERPELKPLAETPNLTPGAAAPEVSQQVEQPWAQPLESPFLPDAKVEKRPLGGDPNNDLLTSASGLAFEEYIEAPDEALLTAPDEARLEETTMPDPIDFAAAAVSDAVNLAETAVEEQQSVEAQVPVELPVEDSVAAPAEPVIETLAAEPVVEVPVGPTSITPQYKEQPATEQSSGAIYDTESYHQAVTQPVKKKSGWFVVLWIVLLVLLGAGVGAAIYFFVLPML